LITSLDFLNKGNKWLPDDADTKNRMHRYNRNQKLFNKENGALESYQESFKRIERVVGNFDNVISYATLINYFRLVSKKTGDLLYGEKPIIDSADNKETIENIIDNTTLFLKLYKSAIDISRYGDSVLYLFDDNGKGNFNVISPKMWIPIVDNVDNAEVVNHVLAWEYNTVVDGKKKTLLNVEIHYIGSIEKRVYELVTQLDYNIKINASSSNKIIGSMISSEVIQTGLSDFAIIHLSNFTTTDSFTGIDDYIDMDDIVQELLVRIAQISRVLDKHASPSVTGSSSALEKDPASGLWKLKLGNYFPVDSSDDVKPEYMTWDGQLQSSFSQIELLINQLYVISEMGSVLLGGSDTGGTNLSGRALRMKMISPLAKIKRITMYIDADIKKLIKLLSELGGESITNLVDEKISITWQDGLPNDALEEAEIIEKRKGSNTISTQTALIRYDQMSEEDADEEIERIQEEELAMNPLSEKPFSGDNMISDGEEDD